MTGGVGVQLSQDGVVPDRIKGLMYIYGSNKSVASIVFVVRQRLGAEKNCNSGVKPNLNGCD